MLYIVEERFKRKGDAPETIWTVLDDLGDVKLYEKVRIDALEGEVESHTIVVHHSSKQVISSYAIVGDH